MSLIGKRPFRLRVLTYMGPGLPVEYFEAVSHYLEAVLAVPTVLMYETRWDGPPTDRPDPFATDEVDLVFMSSAAYLRLIDSRNRYACLLPVTSVHKHCKGEGKPGYFSDVIVREDFRESVKEFQDLRGCSWAYSKPGSLSGYLIALQSLRAMGESPSFFGNLLQSNSHLESIEMVVHRQADAAAVDANCLAIYTDRNPQIKSELFCLESWGPLPPYPLVVNVRLPDSFQTELVNAFLSMHSDPKWGKILDNFKVVKFTENDSFAYDAERDLINNSKGLTSAAIYY